MQTRHEHSSIHVPYRPRSYPSAPARTCYLPSLFTSIAGRIALSRVRLSVPSAAACRLQGCLVNYYTVDLAAHQARFSTNANANTARAKQ